jgi:hypothetical protein
VGQQNLKVIITEYYKKLFGAPETNFFKMREEVTRDITQLSQEENSILTTPFTEEEVFEAISNMEHYKALGPDGFPAEFYQKFWQVIKFDMMAMFAQLQDGDIPLYKLNSGLVTLLPKKEDASRVEEYHPICLLNVSFKIFTKVGTNRATIFAHKVVRPTQSAFIPGRNILEGVVVLHETIHELQMKKMDGVPFKIDFENAYDKVKWSFLQQALRMKGFPPKWCKWIARFIQRGSVGIKANCDFENYFQTLKGLRQGDALLPILFNIVADMLAILIARAKEDGQIGSLVPHLVDGGIFILQFDDDTILFMEHDVAKAINMKLILSFFEQLSGLKINLFIRVRFFALARPRTKKIIIGISSDVKLTLFHLNIWEFLSIIGNY